MNTQIDKLLQIAAAELGVKESPANSNNVKYNSWYYGKPVSGASYPWCVVFVMWCFEQIGALSLVKKCASCTVLRDWAKPLGLWVTSGYKRGDLAIFDFNADGKCDHIGIVDSIASDGSIYTIEGNTSASNASDGGEVRRVNRKPSAVLGAVRPKYDDDAAVFAAIDKIAKRAALDADYWKKRLDLDANMRGLWLKLGEKV